MCVYVCVCVSKKPMSFLNKDAKKILYKILTNLTQKKEPKLHGEMDNSTSCEGNK